MRIFLSFLFTFIYFALCFSQGIELNNIKIARDDYGVPHIMAKTDVEVAYGLGWAECEDQFITMQELMAACKGMLGQIKGKQGIIADFGIKFMGLADFVNNNYEHDVTGNFKLYLESFVDAVNNYAELHPEEVLLKKLFPISGKDVLVGYLLGNVEISGAGVDLQKILNGSIIKELKSNFPKGSNAIAISNNKTKDGKTYLAINSHQPLEGWYSWYEAHLISEEGLNILGGTFAGGICIFHGANENLGWAHTVNHADFSDVYKLTMNSDNTSYLYDGKWMPLVKIKLKAKLKIAGVVTIPIRQTMYKSVYGPTFKTENGFFAWRFVAGQTLKMGEQWYEMNKAKNLKEFKQALQIRGLAALNIVYADKEDNIYYISNGRLPIRNENYNWKEVLPGNTSETLWNENLIPLDSLPQVLNPESGYIFNTNNTPFNSTSQTDNPKETKLNKTMGFQSVGVENNRSNRFMELIADYEMLNYEDLKLIKYDGQYPSNMTMTNVKNLEMLMHLDENLYPDIADAIKILNNWDRKSNIENNTTALFIIALKHLDKLRRDANLTSVGTILPEHLFVDGLRFAKSEMLEKFGSLEIALGDFQRHTRENVNLPIGGAPDVLAAIYSRETKDGTYRAIAGESYIEMVQFGPSGVEIESINAFGASEKPGTPNSTTQMEYFASGKLKKMSLNKEEVLKNAVRIYSPMKAKKD